MKIIKALFAIILITYAGSASDQVEFFKKRFSADLFSEEEKQEAKIETPKKLSVRTSEKKDLLGASVVGSSGLITVPNMTLIPRDTFIGALHMHSINVNGTESTAKYFKMIYGVTEKLEVGFSKPYAGLDNRNDPDMYTFWKYKMKERHMIGGTIDTSSSNDDFRYMQSAYYMYGMKNVYAGIGLNFDFKRKDGIFAHFGSADESKSNLVFLLFGAEYQVNDYVKAMFDFNGDFFSYGVRLGREGLTLDIDQVKRGDNLSLLPFKDDNQTVIGLSWNFR